MRADFDALVERYLQERRALGFELRSQACALRSLARYVRDEDRCGALTMEFMAEWGRRDSHGSTDPKTWARRLKSLRPFTRWLQQFEPRTEVPDSGIFGRIGDRQAPHIYSECEIVDLLAAARRLGPQSSLRGAVYEALFGLLSCTGMRLCEAVALHDEDIDLKAGLLTIRHTKFAKSRQVPLHASAIEALRRYWQMRDLAGTRQDAQAPFFITTRGQRHGMPLGKRQADRVFRRLCNELGWMNRGTHHAPRVHDLRHSFVVRRILLWQQQGVDIDQAMLSLSTYVGHVKVANTYWYLSAVPELMAVSARFFESCMPEVRHA